MKLLVLAFFLSVGATAQADGGIFEGSKFTTAGPFITSLSTTYCAGNGSCDAKLIVERAKDDAATFVGSNGEVRGAQLEQALLVIRKSNPELRASDMDLANQIVAETN